ncbi:MAG: SDR family oxidoreductase [Cyclobacteriaceae bacterium]
MLILGATSDIANALGEAFAKKGDRIILAGRNMTRLKEIAADISIRYDVVTEYLEFDALDYASHEKFYLDIDPQPDIVICVFGYLGDQEVAQRDWKETESIIHTNYTGAISILNIVANEMEKKRSGMIIGISSVAGDRGKLSNYLYGSAKAGFTAYLSGLRNRLYHAGVHVLTIKPGFVATQMTAHLDLPPLLTASPARVANDTLKAVSSRKDIVYSLSRWRLLMFIIRNIPEFLFKRLKL